MSSGSGKFSSYGGPPKHWRNERQLGRGGSAEVWLSYDIDVEPNVPLARKKLWVEGVCCLIALEGLGANTR